MSTSHFGSAKRSLTSEPMQAAGTLVAAIMMAAMLNQISVWFAPLLLLICIAGMVAVTRSRVRAERIRQEGERLVDYQKLAAIDTDKMLPWLKENIRGHDAILESICRSLKKSMQLARPGKTLGNFVLAGPTGTGKTFLATLLASYLFPKSEIVRIRLNECKQSGDVQTLIGPPPGMPGYEVGGHLTRPVLDNPYRVVILDELDRCHHDLHDCLYDILDTATCREKSSGRLVDFTACVFIGTTNAGVEQLRALAEEVGSQSGSAWLGRSRDALAEAGRMDRAFLSRWDGVYLMDQLSPLHVAEVACLQLSQYWREYGIEVGYTDPELILEAVQRNQDFAQYGVRQLGKFIREQTEHAILDARRNGVKKVNLRVGSAAGELEIEVPR